jgi:hypothetical protein
MIACLLSIRQQTTGGTRIDRSCSAVGESAMFGSASPADMCVYVQALLVDFANQSTATILDVHLA